MEGLRRDNQSICVNVVVKAPGMDFAPHRGCLSPKWRRRKNAEFAGAASIQCLE